MAFESERLLAEGRATLSSKMSFWIALKLLEKVRSGKPSSEYASTRIFRASVLTAYGFRCCISGLAVPELLNASHIVPWAEDKATRVNPRNGLCLNALLDRAFDRGLLTVTPEYNIVEISSALKNSDSKAAHASVLRYQGQKIQMPERFAPAADFLQYHNAHVFWA